MEKTNRIRVRIFEEHPGVYNWSAQGKNDDRWLPGPARILQNTTREAAAQSAIRYFGAYPQNRVVFVCQSGEGISA